MGVDKLHSEEDYYNNMIWQSNWHNKMIKYDPSGMLPGVLLILLDCLYGLPNHICIVAYANFDFASAEVIFSLDFWNLWTPNSAENKFYS